jgi:hypothetical protein
MEYSTRSYIHTEHSMYDERGQQVIQLTGTPVH